MTHTEESALTVDPDCAPARKHLCIGWLPEKIQRIDLTIPPFLRRKKEPTHEPTNEPEVRRLPDTDRTEKSQGAAPEAVPQVPQDETGGVQAPVVGK